MTSRSYHVHGRVNATAGPPRERRPLMKLHAAVARTLSDHGVDTTFGVMGDANMLYLVDFREQNGGTFISSVSEGGAVSMADGYSRVSGRLGVASVTHGPGLTNTMTALTEAVRARTPLV